MLAPTGGLTANAPTYDFFRIEVYFDPRKLGAEPAARKLANLFGSADVKRLTPTIRALGNNAMIVAVTGQTFHGRLAAAPVDQTPKRQPASVVSGASAVVDLLREHRAEIPFPLMVPTKIDRSSWIDRELHSGLRDRSRQDAQGGAPDLPARAQRVLGRPDDRLGGCTRARRTELHPQAGMTPTSCTTTVYRLHMVVLKTDGASYWVVNTLLDRLSNETMIAIAKSLRPLATLKST